MKPPPTTDSPTEWLSPQAGYMLLALMEATEAANRGEVPIGAVVSDAQGRILAQGGNQTRSDLDPTAHAEVVVLRQAARRRGDHRLLDTQLHVTLQPCPMCLEALRQARVTTVVYAGQRLWEHSPLPPCSLQQEKASEEVAVGLLSQFFQQKRA
ncbi:MAG: nucleoside deaminase [Magnetococcales bacterium]|nr:nucleoside deaminase [Magnetococcales bacterium]NGZ28573.1 nucleoside deaminase [Magnetococcales bacterium]